MIVPSTRSFVQLVDRILRVVTLATLVILLSHRARAQAQPEAKTLLWEISGNGLQKPSYLYGTMHVRDRRAFDFADSVLVAFKRCSILAEETRLDSAISWVLDQMMKGDGGSDSSASLRTALTPARYHELDSMLQNAYGLSLDQMPHAKPWMVYTLRPPEPDMPKEEPTFLDAHLAHLARLEGMEVVGLETIQEETALFDQLSAADADGFFSMNGGSGPGYEEGIRAYADGDLESLTHSMLGAYSDATIDLVLTRRNMLMVQRMKPLLRQAPTFTAVGAAHLLGPKGIIALLRKDGFTVRPVAATRTGLAARYVPPARKLEWGRLVDSTHGYAAEFPTKPFDRPRDGALGVSVQTAFAIDPETGLNYIAVTLDLAVAGKVDPAKILDAMVKGMPQTSGKKRVERKVTVDGVPAVEAELGYGDGGRMRLQVVQSGIHVHLIGVITETAWHDTLDVQRFFDEFKLIQSSAPASADGTGLATIRQRQGAYSVVMPADTHSSVIRAAEASGDSMSIYILSATDTEGDEYAITYNNLGSDQVVTDDSLYLAGRLEAIVTSVKGSVIREAPTSYGGYPARDIVLAKGEERTLVRSVLRGTRAYVIMASFSPDKGTDRAEKFLSSLTFLPAEEGVWSTFSADTLPFTVSLPGAALGGVRDTVKLGGQLAERSHFIARDESSGAVFLLGYGKIPRNYRADDTATLLQDIGGAAIAKLDSIAPRRIFRRDGDPVGEIIGKGARQNAGFRIRCIQHGDAFFILIMMGDMPDLDSPLGNRFFDSFHATRPAVHAELFGSRLPEILAEIDSRDSARAAAANEELHAGDFGRRDLPTAYAKLPHQRADDTLGSEGVRVALLQILIAHPDSATVPFLAGLFQKSSSEDPLHAGFLKALELVGSTEALDSVASILHRYPTTETIFPHGDLLDDVGLDSVRPVLPRLLDLLDIPSKRIIVLGMVTKLLSDSGGHAALEASLPAIRNATVALAAAARPDTATEEERVPREAIIVKLAWLLPEERRLDPYLRWAVDSTAMPVAFIAALSLEKRGVEVSDAVLERICAHPYLRLAVYRGLKTMDRSNRFPARYRSQKSLAEGMLISHLSDGDVEVDSTDFVAERVLTVGGEQGRYFLFRARIDDAWRAGVIGPYPMDISILDAEDPSVRMADDDYDEANIETYFKDATSETGDDSGE